MEIVTLACRLLASAGDGRGWPLLERSTDGVENDRWRDLSPVMKRLISVDDQSGHDDWQEGDRQTAFDHDGSDDLFGDPATHDDSFETEEFTAIPTPRKIKAQATYSEGAFGRCVKAGVVDEDFDLNHPDLAANVASFEDSEFDVVGVQRSTLNDADIVNLSLVSAEDGFDEAATDTIIPSTDSSLILMIANGNKIGTDDEGNPLGTLPDSDPTAQIVADSWANGLVLAAGVVDENNEVRLNNCCSSKKRSLVAHGINFETTEIGGGTTTVDDLSLSTPAVSGSRALLLDGFPPIAPEDSVEIILEYAIDVGEEGVDDAMAVAWGTPSARRSRWSLPTDDDVQGVL